MADFFAEEWFEMKHLYILMLLLFAACTSPAERFAETINLEMIENDRNDILCDIIANPNYETDSPSWVVKVDRNDVTIDITGEFKTHRDRYRYRLREHYMIDVPEKGYYHYCPDTVTIRGSMGDTIAVIPPYRMK